MSSSITIPPATPSVKLGQFEAGSPSDSSSAGSPYSTSPRAESGSLSSSSSPSSSRPRNQIPHESRPRLISQALSEQECTIIDIGEPDGPTRLISYLSSGQGYMWNPEIFLPSYVDCDYVPLEDRRDPIHEITLTDDEIKNMLPQ